MHKLSTLYSKAAIIIVNTLLLFVLINVLAYFINRPAPYAHYITSPQAMLEQNPTLMQKIYDGKPVEVIADLYAQAPNVKSHPVLEFMTTPCLGNYYRVGFENCRYNSYIDSSNIQQKINQNTWLLGGSTTFGYGVPDDETFAFFLNQLDTANTYINLGAPSFHQRLEIEKLIVLLQKGYRPKRVIFLDGLNDLVSLTSSNFDAAELPAKPYNAYAQDFCVENMGINKNLPYVLPVVKLWYRYRASVIDKTQNTAQENIYDAGALYNKQPYLHYQLNKLHEPAPDSALLQKADAYYMANLTLLDALSKAYNFEYAVFFQPLGLMLERNHFIPDYAAFQKDFSKYTAIKKVYLHVKQRIQNKQYPRFYDLSMAHDVCEYPYVDLTHYSASMNRVMAREIVSHQHIWNADSLPR
ncbi:MAG: hypothetical protein WC150_03970 [Bacteroidia bacterium]